MNHYHQMIERAAQGARRPYGHATVVFDYIEKIDREETEKQKRPVYRTVEIAEVHVPGGDRTPVPVTRQLIDAYPEQYAAFKRAEAQPPVGMPLKLWPLITKGEQRELAFFEVLTVEQLAEAPDELKRKLGPLSKLCKQAKEWIKAAESPQAKVTALQEQLDRERDRVKRMETQIELLMQRIEANEGIRLRGDSSIGSD